MYLASLLLYLIPTYFVSIQRTYKDRRHSRVKAASNYQAMQGETYSSVTLCLSLNESKSTGKASLADAMYTINQEAARVESKMAPGLSWSLAICIAPARLSWPDLTLLPPCCDLPGNVKLKA